MWKKILISGAVGAAILGAGGTALAASGGSSPAPAPTSTGTSAAPAHQKAKDAGRAVLRRTAHATWTTRKDRTFVTHDAIRGTVTAVSSTSITVVAADKTPETYVVNASTKVRDDKASSAIGAVKVGDAVGVLGTGTTTLTATHIVDRGTRSATTS